MEPESFKAYLDKVVLRQLTSHTISSKERLADEIAVCRERGYATAEDELDYGITALAVPVRSPDGDTVAALNTSGYSGRVNAGSLVSERLEYLRSSAKRVWRVLDAHPTLLRSLPRE
jgi:IclR family pca regulon transcriptional regulator